MAQRSVQDRLDEANAAYHDLQIGKAPASVRDSNGEEIRYTQTNPTALVAYIALLESQLNPTVPAVIGPMTFSF